MPTLHDPVAFSVFGLEIRWYALILLSGIVGAIVLIQWLVRRRGMDRDFILDIAPWVVAIAIVCARLGYVLVSWDSFRDDPLDALNIREGGIAIHGAVLGGALVVAWFCRQRRYRFLLWGDLILTGVALGQAIGRWGNWANQEAFGTPTSLPWAVTIDPERRPAEYADQATFHPTFLYESIANLVNVGVMTWVVLRMPGHRWLREGDAVWAYMVLYGVERAIIESIRTDSVYVGPLPGPTWVSLVLIIGGVLGGVLRRTVWPAPAVSR
ncbi:MAG TPA: prolipoprotein diacylglyceryl transferase [Thermomicrobiales bacterium]|jgi:phosphatidylglycerol:prolipoprotein diacylglycerol transferase|nr:prolipoprotein diacylglyceryl transferase [Thermomicrobiales bacterium]